MSTVSSVIDLVRLSQVYHAERPPLFTTFWPCRRSWSTLVI